MMIRPMLLNDIEQVSKIEKECFKEPWSKTEFMYFLNLHDTIAVVYEDMHREISGYGVAILFNSWLHITNLAVKPACRRKQIGSALVSYMLDYAHKRNKEFAILEVRANNLAAINLYKKFGFKQDEVKNSYYSDGEDAIVMKKELNSHPK